MVPRDRNAAWSAAAEAASSASLRGAHLGVANQRRVHLGGEGEQRGDLYQVGAQQDWAVMDRIGVHRAEEAVVTEHGHRVEEAAVMERDHKAEGAVVKDCVHRAEGMGCDERMVPESEDRPLGEAG